MNAPFRTPTLRALSDFGNPFSGNCAKKRRGMCLGRIELNLDSSRLRMLAADSDVAQLDVLK